MGPLGCQQADRAPRLRSTLAVISVVMTRLATGLAHPNADVRQLTQADAGLRWQAGSPSLVPPAERIALSISYCSFPVW